MRSKHLSLLTFAIITPLLMANSPAPSASYSEYSDANYNCELITEGEIENTYRLTIENAGDGFILLERRGFIENKTNKYVLYEPSRVFESEVIPPASSKSLTFSVNNSVKFKTTDYWSCNAYTFIDSAVTFSNVSISQLNSYEFTFNYTIANKSDYYYDAIVEINYEGTSYAFDVELNGSVHMFRSLTALDASKMSIQKVTAIRSSYPTYKGGRNFIWRLVTPIIIVIGSLIFTIGLTILLVVLIRKKRERKYHAHAQSVIHGEKDSDNK